MPIKKGKYDVRCWYCDKDIGEEMFYTGGSDSKSRIHSKCLSQHSKDEGQEEDALAIEAIDKRVLQ